MNPERPDRPEDGEDKQTPQPEAAAAEPAEEAVGPTLVGDEDAVEEEALVPAGELAELRAESDRLLRQLAEADNRHRRMQREREREGERFRGELLEKLLPVVDDLDRAVEQLAPEDESGLAEGLRLVGQRLQDGLGELGLELIPAQGEKFDPRFHEALIQLPNTDAEKGVIVQELQRGYRLGETVIRPSKVAVAG
jgi:molecular chaperone GrpE